MQRFHLAPVLSARDSEAALAHQQAAFPHHAQYPFAIDHQSVIAPQPPSHATVAVGRLLATGQDDFLVLRTIRTTLAWLRLIVEARPADLKRLGHQLRFVPLGH